MKIFDRLLIAVIAIVVVVTVGNWVSYLNKCSSKSEESVSDVKDSQELKVASKVFRTDSFPAVSVETTEEVNNKEKPKAQTLVLLPGT